MKITGTNSSRIVGGVHISGIIVLLLTFMELLGTSLFAQASLAPKQFSYQLIPASVQLIDVRTFEEFHEGHIKGAMLADWYDQNSFKRKVALLNKQAPVLLYCRSGIRSANAKAYLLKIGFKNVVDLDGGLLKWRLEGLPITKG